MPGEAGVGSSPLVQLGECLVAHCRSRRQRHEETEEAESDTSSIVSAEAPRVGHLGRTSRSFCCWERCCGLQTELEAAVHAGMVSKCSRHLGFWRDRWAVLTRSYLSFKKRAPAPYPTESFCLQEVLDVAAHGSEVHLQLRNGRRIFRCSQPVAAEEPRDLRWALQIQLCCDGRH
ncbi:unnamed protein product [Effrenium voratum]|uniref:PH domain-containing protein n=1 Tax=Effrenium voratum TaxID=2562239 RepID=A0AA36IUS4_9DINO|nr:unnamed protein product [Effrenium voratum]